MTLSVTPKLVFRLVAIAIAGALLEIVAVSQVTIFTVSADLSPLIVMAVGLLCATPLGKL